jgi:hypothetical protein
MKTRRLKTNGKYYHRHFIRVLKCCNSNKNAASLLKYFGSWVAIARYLHWMREHGFIKDNGDPTPKAVTILKTIRNE